MRWASFIYAERERARKGGWGAPPCGFQGVMRAYKIGLRLAKAICFTKAHH
uniref:Uncharacterized protein n=1 Tax=Acetithermum autotrophicum TaxID=1446466 RepID=H5SQV8_ACEAU|nr:hypothetical protein HGMM_OP2C025 [Candidatus Acetothermum autotrophicum]